MLPKITCSEAELCNPLRDCWNLQAGLRKDSWMHFELLQFSFSFLCLVLVPGQEDEWAEATCHGTESLGSHVLFLGNSELSLHPLPSSPPIPAFHLPSLPPSKYLWRTYNILSTGAYRGKQGLYAHRAYTLSIFPFELHLRRSFLPPYPKSLNLRGEMVDSLLLSASHQGNITPLSSLLMVTSHSLSKVIKKDFI